MQNMSTKFLFLFLMSFLFIWMTTWLPRIPLQFVCQIFIDLSISLCNYQWIFSFYFLVMEKNCLDLRNFFMKHRYLFPVILEIILGFDQTIAGQLYLALPMIQALFICHFSIQDSTLKKCYLHIIGYTTDIPKITDFFNLCMQSIYLIADFLQWIRKSKKWISLKKNLKNNSI